MKNEPSEWSRGEQNDDGCRGVISSRDSALPRCVNRDIEVRPEKQLTDVISDRLKGRIIHEYKCGLWSRDSDRRGKQSEHFESHLYHPRL